MFAQKDAVFLMGKCQSEDKSGSLCTHADCKHTQLKTLYLGKYINYF